MKTEFDFANSISENLGDSTPGRNIWMHLNTIIFTFGNYQMTGRNKLFCLWCARSYNERAHIFKLKHNNQIFGPEKRSQYASI